MFSTIRGMFGGKSSSVAGPSRGAPSKPPAAPVETKTSTAAHYAIALPGKIEQPGFFTPASAIPPGVKVSGSHLVVKNDEGTLGVVRKEDVCLVASIKVIQAHNIRMEEIQNPRNQEKKDLYIDSMISIFIDSQLIIPKKGLELHIEEALNEFFRSEKVYNETMVFIDNGGDDQTVLITMEGFKQLFDFLWNNRESIMGFYPKLADQLICSDDDQYLRVFLDHLRKHNLLLSQ